MKFLRTELPHECVRHVLAVREEAERLADDLPFRIGSAVGAMVALDLESVGQLPQLIDRGFSPESAVVRVLDEEVPAGIVLFQTPTRRPGDHESDRVSP